MDRRRVSAVLFCLLLIAMLLASCGGRELTPEEEALCGRWAYAFEPEKATLTLKKNGGAEFEGKSYDFTCDGQFLRLTSGKGEDLNLRYHAEDGNMTLFLPAEFTCDGTNDGLVGLWKCEEKNWSFEFTDTGEFTEDGLFTGSYTVDGENGSYTLRYVEDSGFEATVCYFSLDGSRLTVEYPWPMVKMK